MKQLYYPLEAQFQGFYFQKQCLVIEYLVLKTVTTVTVNKPKYIACVGCGSFSKNPLKG